MRGSKSKKNDKKRVDEQIRVNTKKNKKRKTRKEENDEKDSECDNESVVPKRKRGRPKKVRFDPNLVAVAQEERADNENDSDDDEPATYEKALKTKEKSEWLKAINEELNAHKNNNTWSVVDRNASMNVIDAKWVFTKKRDENGVVKRLKARLVARGFHQQYGVDYNETFAPVIKMRSLRLIIALSTTIHTKRKLAQIDVKTAFLNASVKEDIYVSVPQGVNVSENKVLKLNKALYGIKQAPHEWNEEIDSFILSLDFYKCMKDTCVYVKMSKTNNQIILGLFVDDMIISYAEKDEKEWFELKNKLMNKYELSDEGEARKIVGMRLTKRNDYLYIDQTAYVNEKLAEFRMSECRTVSTPGTKRGKIDVQSTATVNKHLYMQIAGSLIYALHTRPDIAHATNIVCRHNSDPQPEHMHAAMHVLRYLKGTTNYGLRYRYYSGDDVVLVGYSDASWADNEDRKSTAGYCVRVNSNLVSWSTRKQNVVATSTTESELIAVFEVVKEIKWLSMLLTEMGFRVRKPVTVFCDNRSTVQITQNSSDQERTKHIDIRMHFVRDEVKNGEVIVRWIETGQQTADIFTKPLEPQPFLTHRNNLVYDPDETD